MVNPRRKLPVGAEVQPEGGVHFRVRAPRSPAVRRKILRTRKPQHWSVKAVDTGPGCYGTRARECTIATSLKAARFQIRLRGFSQPARMPRRRLSIRTPLRGATTTGAVSNRTRASSMKCTSALSRRKAGLVAHLDHACVGSISESSTPRRRSHRVAASRKHGAWRKRSAAGPKPSRQTRPAPKSARVAARPLR